MQNDRFCPHNKCLTCPPTLATTLGDAKFQTTMRYVNSAAEEKLQARRQLERFRAEAIIKAGEANKVTRALRKSRHSRCHFDVQAEGFHPDASGSFLKCELVMKGSDKY